MKMKFVFCSMFMLSNSVMGNPYAGLVCDNAYENVKRADDNIKQQGNNLSKMAKKTLYLRIKDNVQDCLANCSGKKFNYCNEVAKTIESK